MTTLKFDLDKDGIALLTIDVPQRPMNVITPELTRELAAAVERIQSEPGIKGAIITSGKPGSFVAGADLKDLVTIYDTGITAAEAAEHARVLSQIFRRLETCGKPFAAAINGLALGGGLELCLACHFRVLSDDPKSVVGLPEVKVGLLPGAGGTQRLPRLIGIPAALPLLLEGRQVKPAEALKLGIVHTLAPASELVETARQWLLGGGSAEQPWDSKSYRIPGGAGPLAPHAGQTFLAGNALTSSTTNGNYPAPSAILSCVYEGTQVAIDVALRIETKYFGKLLADPVARNLTRTLFINKGAADKLAARPKDVAKSKVIKLGVLGAGMMGAGIAHVSSVAGIEVVLLDATQEQADKGKAGIAALLAKDLARGKTTQEKMDALLIRITPTADYAELSGCDLIVEAVFEKRELKADVTQKAEAIISASTIFGSNTSTLPITGLAHASVRPEQFIGIHFFSPVEKMPLVEIIVGERTTKETVARTLDYIGQLGKTPIVVHDFPGFYTSRVFGCFGQEGLRMLLDGVAPALIENGAKQAGFPVGPLAVSDEITLTLQQDIYRQQDADGIPERYRNTVGREATDIMVNEVKRSGRRFGGGFYDYPENAPKKIWPGLNKVFPLAAQQPDVAEVKKRFLVIMALETARCFEDGVITSPVDADIGSILGIGYPAWTGGALSYIDTVGIDAFVADCQRMAAAYGPRFEPSAWLLERARKGKRFYSDTELA
ncbi:3-hydroxyacyl-CoA dehydrogenase NAD-binding domain-containing protein [Pseudomonas aeruginosa]|uniref:3-hydroxyacyl-CoA dehydrogenase NAD-binding domain-containing protein n=1 Tax=Pseudomonas aeruginosa TaxID=287 RepID=UPI0024C07C8A|nr:3-hydroxyacyl-CoA dehydrogenase NAD-binding domain-containing protein [Pseudomonas aeruginosa]WHV79539.1 3-hydroxyacyl-CoA dehydrogenase NAD-binding domain-containing protein [Pseudomonas aeruginosa]